jgi:hypothetical protein
LAKEESLRCVSLYVIRSPLYHPTETWRVAWPLRALSSRYKLLLPLTLKHSHRTRVIASTSIPFKINCLIYILHPTTRPFSLLVISVVSLPSLPMRSITTSLFFSFFQYIAYYTQSKWAPLKDPSQYFQSDQKLVLFRKPLTSFLRVFIK